MAGEEHKEDSAELPVALEEDDEENAEWWRRVEEHNMWGTIARAEESDFDPEC